MSEPKVKFIVKDFRAVANAEIGLDGISVLTGENGCGKSTISKLVYYSLQSVIDIDGEILGYFQDKSRQIKNTIRKINSEFPDLFSFKNSVPVKPLKKIDFKELRNNLGNRVQAQNIDRLNFILAETLMPELYSYNQHLGEILCIENDSSNKENLKDELFELLDELNLSIYIKEKEIYGLKSAVHIVINSLSEKFSQKNIHFKLFEFGSEIINERENKILPIHSLEEVIYYDTPFVIDQDPPPYVRYLDDIHFKLRYTSNNIKNTNSSIPNSELFLNEFEVIWDSKSSTFKYVRKDNQEFDLSESATGVKSFGIIKLLLQNGYLNNKTLLIIDEPEAHLHPQWIVEYARLIVLLHKELGVKFLISSHNPDMISAIKYIAEKEQIDKKINFYLAEKTADNEFKYNFVNLNTNIEPIFESFNIALDRIDEYGAVE